MILLIILVEEFSKMVSARFDGSRTLLSLSTGRVKRGDLGFEVKSVFF